MERPPRSLVIRAKHLIEKLKKEENLESTIEWLKARKFLPKEGVHFEKVDGDTFTIGNWGLKSPALDFLTRDPFFPC